MRAEIRDDCAENMRNITYTPARFSHFSKNKILSEVYPRKWYVKDMYIINATIRMIIDVIDLLPKYNPFNGADLEIKSSEENVTISWTNRNKKGRILNHQNQPTPLTAPRYIELDENLGEVFGLYFGDGTKNDTSCVELSNSCPELIKLWINHLINFNVMLDDLFFSIKLSENVKIKYKVNEEEIREYWRRALKIPKEKEILINWVKTKSKPSSYLQKYGTCVARYFNITFSVFYNALIENIPQFIETNEQFRLGFIRGVIASDGNINTRKNASLSLVRIAGDKDQRQFISTILLKFLDIQTREDKNNQIYFGNIDNLRKIKELNLHAMHPDKRVKFEKGYKRLLTNLNRKHDKNSILKNKTAISILKTLEKCPLKTQEIMKQFNISREWARDILNGYKHSQKYRYNGIKALGLVSCKRNAKKKSEKIWLITKKGKMFLKNLGQK